MLESRKSDVVVFDLGGVIVDWNPRYLFRKLFDGQEEAMERFLSKVCSPEWNALMDAGLPWEEGVSRLTTDHPEETELISAYRDRWDEMLGGVIEPTVELLAQLRDHGARLYALSNWSSETFPIALERYSVLRWFEGTLVSGEVGMTKPDPRIFEVFCARFRLIPAECLYVDDTEANVRAAAKAGFRASLQFTTAHDLRRSLVAQGVLT